MKFIGKLIKYNKIFLWFNIGNGKIKRIPIKNLQINGAVTKDGVGFNGRDTDFGHSLANWIQSGKSWSPKQAAAATRIAKTYTKQLAKAGIVL